MNLPEPDVKEKIFYIKSSNRIQLIKLSDVIYIQADGNYSKVKLKHDKHIVVCYHLKIIENYLKEYDFLRCHRSYLIRLSQIKEIIRTNKTHAVLINEEVIPVSRRKTQELTRLLRIYINNTAYLVKHTVY